MKNILRNNWFFLLIIIGMVFSFLTRYKDFNTPIVSNPDSQISFGTQNAMLEQTWQTMTKMIRGVSVPYLADSDFVGNVNLKLIDENHDTVLREVQIANKEFLSGQEGTIDFHFPITKLQQGERYFIQLSLTGVDQTGNILIPAGSNYGGCTIDGTDTDHGAAFTLLTVKYSKLFWLIAVLFPALSFSLLFMLIENRKLEETIGFSFFIEGVILYVFGLRNQLVLGLNAIYFFALLCFLISIFLYNRKGKTPRDFLSPGLWIYFIMFGVIIISSAGDWLGYRDDLRHWGIAVRDMFFSDSFANHIGTTVILPRYLPFTASIEYVFEYMNGVFSEDILFIAYQTLLLSTLIIFCKPLQKEKNKILYIPSILFFICIPIIFFNTISSDIRVDSFLAVVFSYVLICYYSEDALWFNKLRIITGILTLVMTKDAGLIFAGIASMIIFGDIVFQQVKTKTLNVKKLLWPILYACMALIVFLSWQMYLKTPEQSMMSDSFKEVEESVTSSDEFIAEDTTKQDKVVNAFSASGISLNGLLHIFRGQGEPYQYQNTRNYLTELFEGETYTFGPLKLSFVAVLGLILFIIVSLSYLKFWKTERERMNAFATFILLGAIVYCCFLQVTYWFSFSMYEALALASFGRYLAPYLCAMVLTMVYLIFERYECIYCNSTKIPFSIFATAFFLVLCTPMAGIITEGKDIEGNTTEEIIYGHDTLAEMIRSIARKGERVYFVCSNSDGYSEYVFRNAVCPVISEHINWDIVATEELNRKRYELYEKDHDSARILDVEEWEEALADCQYLVVFHADDLFRQSYSDVFSEEPIRDGSLYRISEQAGDITLHLVGTTGIKKFR